MDKIAIIGLSCLFPGAKNPEEFWHNLISQQDSTSLATVEDMGIDPAVFYDPAQGNQDKTYSLMGGFIRNFKFNSAEYNLPSKLMEGLDPIFKGTLYVAKQALQHSNYLGNARVLSNCGIILGNLSFPTKFSNQLFSPIYQRTIETALKELLQQDSFRLAASQTSAKLSPYNAMTSSLPSALVAQAFSLSGINFSLDAACSSSLYAVKLACHQLLSQNTDLMLAGAISYADPLFIRMLFSGVQAYPENSISRPLDKLSRGLTPGDGVGMVVLKRYSDAIRDGDRIYATICGCGLSNDGGGKHLLSPNQKGQMLAFERAYAEANLNPRDINYLECHGTGTLLGDTTELASLDAFFGQHRAAPLVGSVKSNVGHLLTAAGIVSLIKVILSMSKEIIPPTINITEPLASPNQVIAPEQIVRSATPWSHNGVPKRGAVSAFGFGGTNAHLILEQPSQFEPNFDADIEPSESVPKTKIAIVGMDTFFGSCDGLDRFERSIYEGTQHFVPVPPHRWKGIEAQEQLLKDYGFAEGKAPLGAYIKDFEIDTLRFKIPPNEADRLNPQQLLMLKVADRALQDARLSQGENVAVIIAMETELSVHQLQQRWNLPWQLEEGLIEAKISLPSEQLSQLKNIVKDSIHHPAQSSEYLGYVGNIIASRISSLWNFNGPSLTLSAGENSTFKALETAKMLLATGEVEAAVVGAVDLAGGFEKVLWHNQLAKANTGTNTLSYDGQANGWMVGEGAGAVVLKRLETAKQEQDRIYAVIEAISLVQDCPSREKVKSFPQPPDSEALAQACQQAFSQAGIKPTDIGYLEVFGSGLQPQDESEIKGLLGAYQTPQSDLSCAIGTVTANIGNTEVASGIASLIKTALCLYHRYIPGVPQWSGPKMPEFWQTSPFYVASESKPWFLPKEASQRVAAINGMGLDGTYAHLILSEEPSQKERSSKYLEQMPFYLFPIAADDRSTLLEQLSNLQQAIEDCTSLSAAASQAFATFQKRSGATYALGILGHNQDELVREIQRALQGVANAFERGEDWQTPGGSYFTAKPLGKRGKIAFVYPGAYGAYVGLGRNCFRLFPKIYDDLILRSVGSRVANVDRLLYPRSLNKFSIRQLESLEKQLIDDPQAMLETEIAYAGLTSAILKDYFQVQPQCAFGCSVGETSMVVSQGVWTNFNQGSHNFNSSPLFGDRLSGPKNAVRNYWGLPQKQDCEGEELWGNYVLMASASQVKEHLKDEKRVYLTQINTPQEVVIGGEPQACQRAIDALNCNAFRAPFNHAIHCEAIRSEYDELVKLNTLPIQNVPDIVFYSAAEYKPIKLDSHSIGHSLAKTLCQQVDFPRLINRVYEDGSRIFIETGAGSICSRWIGETLKQKEHVTVSCNQRGIDEHKSFVRALAKLVSHRVSLDLSPLYCQVQEGSHPSKSIVSKITLGGPQITSIILSQKNKETFKNVYSNSLFKNPGGRQPIPTKINKQQKVNYPKIKSDKMNLKIGDQSHLLSESRSAKNHPNTEIQEEFVSPGNFSSEEALVNKRKNHQSIPISQSVTPKFSDLGYLQYRKLSENNSQATKAHAAFLQARQESLRQSSEIIKLQIAFSQQWLTQEPSIDDQ